MSSASGDLPAIDSEMNTYLHTTPLSRYQYPRRTLKVVWISIDCEAAHNKDPFSQIHTNGETDDLIHMFQRYLLRMRHFAHSKYC